jgi:hypothetical protein
MLRRLTVIIPVAILFVALTQNMGMTKRVFDTELAFNQTAGQSYHYAQMVNLRGSEISFQRVEEFQGTIQTIFDEVCTGNSDGLISSSLQFQTYEVLGEVSGIWDEQPFGGPFGPGRGPRSGQEGPDIQPPMDEKAPEQPAPQQEGGGGGSGGGGGGIGPGGGGGSGGGSGGSGGSGGGNEWGQRDRRDTASGFRITPILETHLDYTIGQDGKLLDMQGLDLIGDFYDPQNQISVRQVFQSAHFVTLPNYEVHIGESWRGPMFWTIPFVGETRKLDIQYTLEEIMVRERARLARISFYGIDQFNTVTTDEKWDDEFSSDVRVDSDIQCDVMLNGSLLFDIDRGILVAIGNDIQMKPYRYYVDPNSFPQPDGGILLSTIVVDRVDTRTPLGNVLDNEPRVDQIVQDMVWRTSLILE